MKNITQKQIKKLIAEMTLAIEGKDINLDYFLAAKKTLSGKSLNADNPMLADVTSSLQVIYKCQRVIDAGGTIHTEILKENIFEAITAFELYAETELRPIADLPAIKREVRNVI